MLERLGTYAVGDRPASNSLGIFKVPGKGWYVALYARTEGPFDSDQMALAALTPTEVHKLRIRRNAILITTAVSALTALAASLILLWR